MKGRSNAGTRVRTALARRIPVAWKKSARSKIHPARRAQLARLTSPATARGPLLSVIIPMYNVEPYLADCLYSVLSQSYQNLEIVVVDDGSTDGSLQVAKNFARLDRRITIRQVAHGGNGRARNIGIAQARGAYLTFADSDDIVARHAYRVMMDSLRASGSDFVVGSSDRLTGKKRESTRLSTRLHSVERRGTTIEDDPDIIDDVFLWNKIFWRSFWDNSVGPMPEGIRYEDQETTARAYVRATAFDVVADHVYSWRIRGDGSSITQGKFNDDDLVDRLRVAGAVSELLESEAAAPVLNVWYRRLFGSDLMSYYELIPHVDEAYWSTLQAGVAELVHMWHSGRAPDTNGMAGIGPHERILTHLVALGERYDAETVLVDRMDYGKAYPIDVVEDGFMAKPHHIPLLATQVPERLLRIDPTDLDVVFHLDRSSNDQGRDVSLSGHAYIQGIDTSRCQISRRLFLTDASGRQRDELALTDAPNPMIDVYANDSFTSYAASGFEVQAPVDTDATPLWDLPAGWTAEMEISIGGRVLKRRLSLDTLRRGAESPRRPDGPQAVVFSVSPQEKEFTVTVRWPATWSSSDKVSAQTSLATKSSVLWPRRTWCDADTGLTHHVFDFGIEAWGRQLPAPSSGAYTLRYSRVGGETSAVASAISVSDDLWNRLPLETSTALANFSAWATGNRSFAVTIGPPLAIGERGRYHQQCLQQRYMGRPLEQNQVAPDTNGAPSDLTDAVFFESFGGKFCTDSPRQMSDTLHELQPNLPIYWSIIGFSVEYPAYAIPVVTGTEAWYRALSTCQTLVNNNNFPHYFHKQPGQKYVQTWHGTPIKKIGNDAPITYLSPSYRRLMGREAAYWDTLLAQNTYSANIFRSAFSYSGEILELGYPRNDSLFIDDDGYTRRTVRAILGISEDEKVLLYAPTWRDNQRNESGGFGYRPLLDIEQLKRELGPEWVVLLRGHHNLPPLLAENDADGIIDVSSYPEINELFHASDALISDYSSCVIDYSATGKPVFLFVPDIEDYSSSTRGLYLDFRVWGKGVYAADVMSLSRLLEEKRGYDFASGWSQRQRAFWGGHDKQSSPRVLWRALNQAMGESRPSGL